MSDATSNPYAKAEELGLEVVVPGANELQVDLDTDEQKLVFVTMSSRMAKAGVKMSVESTTSSGGNTHMHCTLTSGALMDGLTVRDVALVRIALQACLGSDPMREFLSLLRVLRNRDCPPTVLFEVPGAVRTRFEIPEPRARAIAVGEL